MLPPPPLPPAGAAAMLPPLVSMTCSVNCVGRLLPYASLACHEICWLPTGAALCHASKPDAESVAPAGSADA